MSIIKQDYGEIGGGVEPEYIDITPTSGVAKVTMLSGWWTSTNSSGTGAPAAIGYIINGVNTILWKHPDYATVNYDATTNELTVSINTSIYPNNHLLVFKAE